jgi:hypothetical protein
MVRPLMVASSYLVAVFDVVDAYARDRKTAGPHPRPFSRVRFEAVGIKAANGERRWDPPRALHVTRSVSGAYVFAAELEPAVRGTDRELVIPAAGESLRLCVRGCAAGYRTTDPQDVAVPPRAVAPAPAVKPAIIPFELGPGADYPIERFALPPASRGPRLVRGVARDTDGELLAEVEVRLDVGGEHVDRYPATTETGQFFFVVSASAPAGPIDISGTRRVNAPDGTTTELTRPAVLKTGEPPDDRLITATITF